MGTNLKELVESKEIKIDELKGKVLAVDSFNILYQFLTTIRQRDGSLLKDSKGNITSHLTGLFSRTVKLMQKGIRLIFVFDGKAPELKNKEIERWGAVIIEAKKLYKTAVKAKDIEAMRKYASRTAILTKEMVDESKKLIIALGLPVVQAKSEGEAQVAYIVNQRDAFAGISEDYDCLLYGIPRVIKNLTISRRRKKGASYISVKTKIINLADTLNKLGIDQDQLIILAILIGTDYNIGGVKGIGPKTALKLVKEFKNNWDDLFENVKWNEQFDFPWTDIFYLIKKMSVAKDYKLEWKEIDKKKILKMLVEEHDFSEERVNKALDNLTESKSKKGQKGLGEWF